MSRTNHKPIDLETVNYIRGEIHARPIACLPQQWFRMTEVERFLWALDDHGRPKNGFIATTQPETLKVEFHQMMRVKWKLTERELQVWSLCINGLSNVRIARQLGIGAETVNKHLDSIYRKSGLSGRMNLIAYFLKTFVGIP